MAESLSPAHNGNGLQRDIIAHFVLESIQKNTYLIAIDLHIIQAFKAGVNFDTNKLKYTVMLILQSVGIVIMLHLKSICNSDV